MMINEFNSMAEMEDHVNSFARASRHPVHVDLGSEYDREAVVRLDQADLEGGTAELAQVEPIDDLHVVWNSRDDRRAYIGSTRYNLIQHREVTDAIREAVDATVGSIQTGVIRDYGERIDGILVFGDQEEALIDVEDLVGGDYVTPEMTGMKDEIGLGMRFWNSFDGRTGVGGSTMGYRYICSNWMVWGEELIDETNGYHIKSEDTAPGIEPEYFDELIEGVFERRDPLEGLIKGAIEDGEMPIDWARPTLEAAGFGRRYQRDVVGKIGEWRGSDPGDIDTWILYNAATTLLDNVKVGELGPERYYHHQGNAWQILTGEPVAPGDGDEEEDETDCEEWTETALAAGVTG